MQWLEIITQSSFLLIGWAAAAPYIAAGVGSLASGMASGKGNKSTAFLRSGQKQAVNELRGIISGSQPLATAGSKAYLGLLGQGGVGLGDLGPLGEIASSGLPSDINPLVTATKDVAYRNIDEQARALQAQFGPQGGRFSSDVYRGAGLVRERGTQDLNETLARLAYGAAEQAAGRRLVGSELLANVGGAARQSALAPLGIMLGQPVTPVGPSGAAQAAMTFAPPAAYQASVQQGGKGGGGKGTGNTAYTPGVPTSGGSL